MTYAEYVTLRNHRFPALDLKGRDTRQLCERVALNRFLYVHGATGSGKTTTLPIVTYLVDIVRGDPAPFIVVVLPRRVLVEAAAAKLRQDLGETDSEHSIVGWAHGHGSDKPAHMKILFATSGWVLMRASDSEWQSSVTSFIVDEVHEESGELSVLMMLLKLDSVPPPSWTGSTDRKRIILMSATGNDADWRDFFTVTDDYGVTHQPGPNCVHEVLPPPGSQVFQRHIFHHASPEDYPIAAAQLVFHLLGETNGVILVFVAGVDDMKATHFELKSLLRDTQHAHVPIHRLYGEQGVHERSLAIAHTNQRVIISTNVAETGLTIHNVTIVCDTGMRKRAYYDVARQETSLERSLISKSSAIQRAGRTGRTCHGQVHRLYTQDVYESMVESDPSDIGMGDNTRILLIVAAKFGSTSRVVELHNPPSGDRYFQGLSRLIQVGAVNNRGQWVPDKHPIASPDIYLDTSLSFAHTSILVGSIKYRCVHAAIILVSILEVRTILHRDTSLESERVKNEFWSPYGTPFHLLVAYGKLLSATSIGQEAKWMRKYGLDTTSVTLVRQKVEELRSKLALFLAEPDEAPHDMEPLVKAYAWGTWQNVAFQRSPDEFETTDGGRYKIPKWEAAWLTSQNSSDLVVLGLTREPREGQSDKLLVNVVPISIDTYHQVRSDMRWVQQAVSDF